MGESSPGYDLGSKFWSDFYAAFWEEHGHVLRKPFSQPLASPREAFNWILKASARYRSGEQRLPIQFYLEHAKILADIQKLLPDTQDSSASAYAERIGREQEGRKFGLVVDDIHTDEELWPRLREFLRPLYKFTGIPGEANATLFLGNYSKTPFGVHKGLSTNFMFVIQGRKRIRAWPGNFFEGKPNPAHTLDYEQFLADAITLEGEAGDVLYWPASYWHIGEDAGGLSVAISLQLFADYSFSARLLHRAAPDLERRLLMQNLPATLPVSIDQPGESAAAVPKLVKLAARAFEDASRDPRFHNVLLSVSLRHITGLGFHNFPAPLSDGALGPEQVICADPGHPILWLFTCDNNVLCAANGHCLAIAAHPNIVKLVERLNTGAPARVEQLINEYAGSVESDGVCFEATSADIQDFLERLFRLRGVRAPSC